MYGLSHSGENRVTACPYDSIETALRFLFIMLRVFILPSGTWVWQQPSGKCSFAGLSALGGVTDPRGGVFGAVLISGNVVNEMSIYAHELG